VSVASAMKLSIQRVQHPSDWRGWKFQHRSVSSACPCIRWISVRAVSSLWPEWYRASGRAARQDRNAGREGGVCLSVLGVL